MYSRVWLHEMTWPDVEDALSKGRDVVIIPIGSVEQHGRHLPLGSDSYVAIALAEDAALMTGAIVTPPIWFGWSPHHMALPGTISIRPEVLIEFLHDVLSSLIEHGFRKFIIVNGHRIVNIPWMQIAAERVQKEYGVKIVIFDPAYMSREVSDKLGFGPVGHAEEIETSHILFKLPNLVRMEEAKNYIPPEKVLYHVDPRVNRDTLCYIPSRREDVKKLKDISGGAVGKPTEASIEKGRKYHEYLVSRLIEVINMLKGAGNV
ncbi:MAG: creatininase family protein [Candidatus Methanomethylicia archaeon]